MDHNLELSQLVSQGKIVKSLAKIAIFSSATSIVVLIYGFIIPDPVIFVSIVLIPVLIIMANNTIDKVYQRKTEYLLNDLHSAEFDEKITDNHRITDKLSNYSNSEYLRIRGGDEKGPAFGKDNRNFSTHAKRIDAMANRDYDGITATSTDAEKMIRVADDFQSEKSAQQWKKSESTDTDLIEAGVKNLGDLVKSGWFDKNQDEGAVKRLYENTEGNQI